MATLADYQDSKKLNATDHSLASLIFAAIQKADNFNLNRFRMVFPEYYDEFMARYQAPGGAINESEKAILFLRTEHEDAGEVSDVCRDAVKKLDAEMTELDKEVQVNLNRYWMVDGCSSCGKNHNNIRLLISPKGYYFICPNTKSEVRVEITEIPELERAILSRKGKG
jgi:hypothetical protein